MIRKSHTLATKNYLSGGRLLMAGLAVTAATTFGTVGVAAAESPGGNSAGPSNVTMCQSDFKQFDFKSSTDCTNWWQNQHEGDGYGGHEHHHHHHHHHFNFGDFENFFRHFNF